MTAFATLQRCSCGGTPGPDGECAACKANRLQRLATGQGPETAPPVVRDVLSSPGSPVEPQARAFMENRFGHDFSSVRVHTDARAAESARSVGAAAYTVGSDVVFDQGRYAPATGAGAHLLAHELAHVVQQGGNAPDGPVAIAPEASGLEHEASAAADGALTTGTAGVAQRSTAGALMQRTPARQVNCAPGPLNIAGPPPLTIADPVAVITAAEDLANSWLDDAIAELDGTITAIAGGAAVAWPTIGDALAEGLRLMGLDPDDPAVWSGRGIGSARLLLRRLSLIRTTIGAGSFFFTCIGPATGSVGACTGTICGASGDVNNAVSCGGSFRLTFCRPWWSLGPEQQAETLLHESCHNFADFIQDRGREGNAGCYARFTQVVAGVDPAFQRADLCPDP